MTDPGMADATYVGPMTPELVEQILDKVRVVCGCVVCCVFCVLCCWAVVTGVCYTVPAFSNLHHCTACN